MGTSADLQPQPAAVRACTVSRDVQNFDLLIEDMEAELGEAWGDLTFEDAILFLDQPDARALEFLAIAIDEDDEAHLPMIAELVRRARERDIKAILITEEVSPIALHQLLKMGAEEFVPYPLPDGALHEAIERLNAPTPEPAEAVPDAMRNTMKATGDRDGVLLPVHGLAGGVGATTFAVNLAWELTGVSAAKPPRVCLLDFDLQFGSVSTFLDLPRREAIYELLSDTEGMDSDAFMQALLTFNDKLHVLTSPAELLPLDIVGPEDIDRVIEMARTNFDYVVIDMPTTVTAWTETVLQAAHVYFALIELDMRSAQNTLRLVRALKGEDLPYDRLRYVLNRAPRFTDLSGRSRAKRLAESLDIDLEVQLPDGGRPVSEANDHGTPLAEVAAKNALRKELQKLAASIHDLNQADVAEAS